MVKFKLRQRSKKNEEVRVEDTSSKKEFKKLKETTINRETKENPKEIPIKEYDETLYSSGSAQKHIEILTAEKSQPQRRISWENAETIEQNIDTLNPEQSETPSSRTQTRINTEKKIDLILLKKKNR